MTTSPTHSRPSQISLLTSPPASPIISNSSGSSARVGRVLWWDYPLARPLFSGGPVQNRDLSFPTRSRWAWSGAVGGGQRVRTQRGPDPRHPRSETRGPPRRSGLPPPGHELRRAPTYAAPTWQIGPPPRAHSQARGRTFSQSSQLTIPQPGQISELRRSPSCRTYVQTIRTSVRAWRNKASNGVC